MLKQICHNLQKFKCYRCDSSYRLKLKDLNILQQIVICINWVSENYPQKGAFSERNLWYRLVIAHLAIFLDLL